MPRRASKPVRITAARVEQCLDQLAMIMDHAGADAHLAVPLWKRLESEIERLGDAEAVVTAARQRVTRSRGRTAAQSG